MLQKSNSKKVWQLKYLLLVPIVLVMLMYTSCESEGIRNTNNTITVLDIENLTIEEEIKVFDKLKSLAKSSEDWSLFVKDGSSTMKFIPSNSRSYISGPNNEMIPARLAIDSKLNTGNSNSISNGLFDGLKANGLKAGNLAAKYNVLVSERQRLLKNMSEENPIILSIDEDIEKLKLSLEEDRKKQIERIDRLQESLEKDRAGNTQEEVIVPFATIDEVPIFPGCEDADDKKACFLKSMQEHIGEHFKYPEKAQKNGIQGRVSLMFIVGKDGVVHDIRKRGPHKLLENEAQRIIALLPKMTPGKQGKEPVNVPFSIPITFKL